MKMKEYLLHEFGKESGKRIFGEIAKECAVLEELYTVLHSSLWEAEAIQSKPDQFGFMVHRCLWNDTCQKCGCPELCKVFCDSDWENFGAMHKIRFSRTQTLGTGGKVCDFTFSK